MTGFLTRLVIWFNFWNRRRKARIIAEEMQASGLHRVLLVGVSRTSDAAENLVEVHVAARADVAVGCGLDVPIECRWDRYVVCDGVHLPFRAAAFDLVVSNAVIEHVGDESRQLRFVAEHNRVGRLWIITTPNRLFPVEPHTRVLFRHWKAGFRARQQHAFTRILSRGEFRRLLPPGTRIRGSVASPTFLATGGQTDRRAGSPS